MTVLNDFLIRLFDTKETGTDFSKSIQTIIEEYQAVFPHYRLKFWVVNPRKNEIKIFALSDGDIKVKEFPLSQFKYENLLRSKSKPFYAFDSKKQKRILIPLFIENVLSGCVAVSARKSKSMSAWKTRLPYFFIAAKRFVKVLEVSAKNNAIDTLMELNQTLENKVTQIDLSLEHEKRAHMQAGKMATLGEVAVGIAHEINNPLTIIVSRLGNLEKNLLKKNMLLPEIADSIVKVNQTVERIVKIINGLRHFAYNGEEKKSPVVLTKVISDSLELCQERLKKNDIELKIKKPAFDVEISAYDTQMIQVLLNLIINSLDAIKNLSEKWIEIEYKIEAESLNVIVRDSGSGLASDVADKIMNPFYTTKERGQGTGLGLSLSKAIVENHEGRLFYNSKSAHTEFVIELPYMRVLDMIVE
tara:strand:- start:1143 stop:2390 length:1248 start_codon:yes stop_codon:yes gene_type:complete